MSTITTGVQGLDDILRGGIPRGDIVLVHGGPGSGKTLFGLTCAVRNAEQGKCAMVLHFEEMRKKLIRNGSSIGLPIETLVDGESLRIESAATRDRTVVLDSFSFDALFLRITSSVEKYDIDLLVLDTLDALYSQFNDVSDLRSVLSNLFNWLRDRGVTTLVTGELKDQSSGHLDMSAYIVDMVIKLDQRVNSDFATRRLRVSKARGISHENNEFPFIIDSQGIATIPVTSARLTHEVVREHYSTGVAALDERVGGNGLRRASTALITGGPGAGKTMLGAVIAAGSVERGERTLLISYEESPDEYLYNVGSAGEVMRKAAGEGLLKIVSTRPTSVGVEAHVVALGRTIEVFQPQLVLIDPISSLLGAGSQIHVQRMIVRIVDLLKSRKISAVLTSSDVGDTLEALEIDATSIIDTWVKLEADRECDDGAGQLVVVKSRGESIKRTAVPYRLSKRGLTLE